MKAAIEFLAGLVRVAGLVMDFINRKDIEAAGRARQVAEDAAKNREREDDANAETRRARDALRGPDADRLRERHFRD